jgi:hypothetical protein
MGSGHPDLYKAFCWRFWNLITPDSGRLGVVLPRAVLAARGSAEFRKAVFAGTREVQITTLVNNRQWVFDEVHPSTPWGWSRSVAERPTRRPSGCAAIQLARTLPEGV